MRATAPFPRTREKSNVKQPARSGPRWLLLPLVLALVAGTLFWWLPSRLAPQTTLTTANVTQGNLTLTVTGSGSIAAARTIDVPFQQAGTVTAVNVKVGDQVKAGDVLAQLDSGDLQLQLQQAQANQKSAEAQLGQAQNGSATPQDLASAKAAVDSAKAQLQQTKTGTATAADIKSAQASLEAAQAKLDALKNPTEADVSAAQTSLNQAQTTLQTQRNSLSAAKTSAYNSMQQSVNSLTQAQTNYAKAKTDWEYVQANGTDPSSPTTTDSNGKKTKNKLSDSQRQQFYDTFVQAEASMHSAETAVQQAQLNYESAQKAEAAQIPELEQQVANEQTQFNALQNPSANDVKQAQAAVVQAQANLDKLRQGGTAADIAKSQAAVTQAEASLEKLTAPAAAPDIASAEAGVVQAQVAVSTAQRNLDQATLKAPIDGIVSAVTVQTGSISSTGTAAVTLVDRSKLHVDISLSETDAAKVQVGQPVTLTFDALPDVTVTGKVASIAPAATVSQNVVTYPVQVEFDSSNPQVKVGMSATADIQIQQINNAVLVPSRAVQTVGNNHAVTVIQGDQQIPVTVQVQTGTTSNGQTEIISCVDTGAQCLRPGDVLSIVTTTTTASSQQGTNRGAFPGGGFPGGGGAFPGAGGGRNFGGGR